MEAVASNPLADRLSRAQITARLGNCGKLPSLRSITGLLNELLDAEHRYLIQICDVIRRDPSMATRLLRVANSAYQGLSTPVSSIEEAVFFLGLRHVRFLAMTTPVVEELSKAAGHSRFAWRGFWQHCICTALLTTETMAALDYSPDELNYLAGLLHDIGKLAMAAVFPDHFAEVLRQMEEGATNLREVEQNTLGMDHGELGALYLEKQRLPDPIVAVARHHHEPENAPHHPPLVAAVQIANLMTRHAGIGQSGDIQPISADECRAASGWPLLVPDPERHAGVWADLERGLHRLPGIVEGLF